MKNFEPKVEMWDIARIKPYEKNNKKHPEFQIAKIATSIAEFGNDQPVVVDGDGILIKGHGRRLGAMKLGLKQLPVIVRTDLTPAQIRAARIADNRVAQSDFDLDALFAEMDALNDEGYDLSLTGFDPDEIANLFGIVPSEGLTDPDDVPEPPVNPIAVEGDVWLLGNHRLACGSSTDADTVAKVLNGVKPHLMVTDPPYGVEYEPKWRAERGLNKNKGKMGVVLNDDRADWTEAWALFPGDVAYVWCASMFNDVVITSLENCGLERRSQIIWAKDRFTLGRGHYHWQHEPCWYAVRKSATGHWAGDRKQTTIWNIKARDDSGVGHGTQKPVECMKRPIENNSSPGQAIYEPFSGSGTTIIAGEITGRSVHAIELNPAYVDVAVKRWQDFTGQEAKLEGDGRTFNEMCEVRYAGGDWAKNAKGSYDDAVAAAHVKTRGKDAAD